MLIRIMGAVALVLALATCGSSEEAETQIAVRYSANGGLLDATVSDGSAELRFQGVAAGVTSNFQSAMFDSLSGLTVRVGTVNSTVDLTEGASNIIDIDGDGKVTGVFLPIGGGSETGGGW